MATATPTTRFRFWLSPVRFIGLLVPRRLRAAWRQKWEAELRYREAMLAEWERLNWRTKLDLWQRSLGTCWVALSVVIGLGAALATTRWAESLLFGSKPNDPLTIGLAALVLLTVAAVAGYLPAHKAARVDLLVALRHE